MEARDLVLDLLRRGFTQQQIAERTGIPQPTISKIARGAVKDVLSRAYVRLQTFHAEEMAKPAPPPAEEPATNGA